MGKTIARQLKFFEKTRTKGLPWDFSELANGNELKVHDIIQETQVTKSDLQSFLAFNHQFTLDEI